MHDIKILAMDTGDHVYLLLFPLLLDGWLRLRSWFRLFLPLFRLRVRQNVMFEYGLCIGALKREKVCPLVKKGPPTIEIPSDILGYGYPSFADSVLECKEAIRRELEVVGYHLRKPGRDTNH